MINRHSQRGLAAQTWAVVALCVVASPAACTGNSDKPSPSDDDSTKPECSTNADCGDGRTCTYLGECVFVSVTNDDDGEPATNGPGEDDDDSETSSDDTTVGDDDAIPPADDKIDDDQPATTTLIDREWPFMYDSYADIPADAWSPRVGCEPPNSPIVRIKYELTPRELIEAPDSWPFNDPNVLWIDEVTIRSYTVHEDLLVWNVAIDRSQDFGRASEYACITTRVLNLQTREAYEYTCAPGTWYYQGGAVLEGGNPVTRRNTGPGESGVGQERVLAISREAENCHEVVFNAPRDFGVFPYDADADNVIFSTLPNSMDERGTQYLFTDSTRRLIELSQPALGQGGWSLRGDFVAMIGRDTEGMWAEPFLYQISDGSLKKFWGCQALSPQTNGQYMAWSNPCDFASYVSLYDTRNDTLTEKFHAGGFPRFNEHTIFLIDHPPDGGPQGSGLLAIDLETGRERYLTKDGWPYLAPTVDGKWVAFTIDGAGLFLWDLEKAGFTDADGRLTVDDE